MMKSEAKLSRFNSGVPFMVIDNIILNLYALCRSVVHKPVIPEQSGIQ
jgi:hypothetical protein